MFKNETVFILGAGSSKPYDYPLGKELIKEIIDDIKKDSLHVLYLHNLSTKYYFNDNVGKIENGNIQGGYELTDFIEGLTQIDIKRFNGHNPVPVMGSNNQSVTIDSKTYVPAKLKQFKDFL